MILSTCVRRLSWLQDNNSQGVITVIKKLLLEDPGFSHIDNQNNFAYSIATDGGLLDVTFVGFGKLRPDRSD